MPNKVFALILFLSMLICAWTFASPPAGTPGGTWNALFGDSTGNIGIKTTTPATRLDVNGTTTVRNSLDMASNSITNVATPLLGLDAVNKSYIDTLIANSSTTIKLWGEGRPGTGVTNTIGECTSTISAAIKVSRSTRLATWDGARAACPANWWVCSKAERGTKACGAATTRNIVYCDVTGGVLTGTEADDMALVTGNNWGWVSNTATTTLLFGKIVQAASGGASSDQYSCNLLPVWCCSS